MKKRTKMLPEKYRYLINRTEGANGNRCHFITVMRLLKNNMVLMILSAMIIMMAACEKVIEVDLNDSEPEIVIEGNLSNDNGVLEVKISKTGSYFNTAPYEKVANAEVFLDAGPGYRQKAMETAE